MVVLPLDLCVPLGPIPGAEDQSPLVDMAGALGVDGVLLRWGEALRLGARLSPDVALIVRLSGSTAAGEGGFDGVLHSVEGALALGGDGVCVDFQLGHEREPEMMRGVANVCEACERLGAFCLVEAHPAVTSAENGENADRIRWAARVAQELGADVVKVAHPGTAEHTAAVVRECQVPVIVAGGSPISPADLLDRVETALTGGAAGTAIGRNVITSPDPAALQRIVLAMVHENRSARSALAELLETMPG